MIQQESTKISINCRIMHNNGADHFWSVMRDLNRNGSWSVTDVYQLSNCPLNHVQRFAAKLLRVGIIRENGTKTGKRPHQHQVLYSIVKNTKFTPRISRNDEVLGKTANEAMWIVMRVKKCFTQDDLIASCAGTSADDVPAHKAKKFIRQLLNAGILINVDKKPKIRATFRLINDLGPRTPKIVDAEMVFDPNSQTIVGDAMVEVLQ